MKMEPVLTKARTKAPVSLLVFVVLCCAGLDFVLATCDDILPSGNVNHTLLVSATVSNSTITLTCSISNMPYVSPSHYLKWSEKGRDLPLDGDGGTDRYSVNVDQNTGSTLLTIHNAGTADYGEYTCRCYNNVSVSGVVDIYNTDAQDYVYHHHCSDPFTVVADPPDQVVNISDHVVQSKNEVVTLDCQNGNEPGLQLMYVTANRTIDDGHLETPLNITVDSASKQGKYVCIDGNNRLAQIHYISIKDYEPPVFMLPTLSNNHPTIYAPNDNTARIPVCAVYSTLPFISYKFQSFLAGLNYYISTSESESNNGLHFLLNYNVPHYTESECEFQTDWETIIFTDYKISAVQNDVTPTACLWMTVEPFDVTDIKYGGSFTVLCNVLRRSSLMNAEETIELLYSPEDGVNSTVSIQPQRSELGEAGHDVKTYYFEFGNVTELHSGEYICRYTYGTTVEEEASIMIPVIAKPAVSSSALSPPLIPSSVNPSMTTPTKAPPSQQLLRTSISTQPALSSVPSITISPPAFISATTSPSPSLQPVLIGVVVSCSIVLIMVILVAAVLGLFAMYCRHRQQRKRTEAVNKVSVEGGVAEQLEETRYDPELDRVSIRSFTSLTDNGHSEKKISENMKKCARQLIVSNWFIPYDKILFRESLGSGAFGKVKRAEIFGIYNSNCISNVAVKMLKDDANEEAEKGIIMEFNVLQNVGAHQNLVSLLGASLHNGKIALIVEFCPGGDLLKYLRKQGSIKPPQQQELNTSKQIDMARQVACGMGYLASKKCVHRDLAARNILIAKDGTLKVSDFGLARETYHSLYQMTTKGKIPFKWMAPESIFYQLYTTNSDVWSFGVLLWEIMTLGCSPYPGKSVEEVIKDLQEEKLMERPGNCPVEVFDVILMCWKFEASERVSFASLEQLLGKLDFKDQDPPTHLTSSTAALNNPPIRIIDTLHLPSSTNETSANSDSTLPPLTRTVYVAQSTTSQQSRDDDYYDEDCLESEGYVTCCDTKGIPVTNLPPLEAANLSHERASKHSTALSSVSDVFTDDSDGSSSSSYKVSPVVSNRTDSGTYSHSDSSCTSVIMAGDFSRHSIITGGSGNTGRSGYLPATGITDSSTAYKPASMYSNLSYQTGIQGNGSGCLSTML